MKRLLLLLAIAGCDAGDPFSPNSAVPFTPPTEYRFWWSQIEECSGITGAFERVRWYEVLGVDRFPSPAGETAGYWTPPHDIYLATFWATDSPIYFQRLVKHEMLHDLTGSGAHGPSFETCGV